MASAVAPVRERAPRTAEAAPVRTSGTLSWWQLTRLGLVQAAIGAVVVLLTTTINRVIVVELGMPASVPGFLVALHFGVQLILRPRLGRASDRIGSRTAWIRGGLLVCAVGGVAVAAALPVMRTNVALGIALAALASVLLGAGVSAAGTPLLALMSERSTTAQRAGAAAIAWILMIVGIIITSVTAGQLLDPFSFERLIAVAGGVGAVGFGISLVATLGVERDARPAAASTEPAVTASFLTALRTVLAEPAARLFAASCSSRCSRTARRISFSSPLPGSRSA